MLAHIDDEEFPKFGSIRIKAIDRPPTWDPKNSEKWIREKIQTRKDKIGEAER
jgi:hypothetical protein